MVTSLITKRDEILAQAVENAIKKGLPLDSLTSAKRDYLVRPNHMFLIHFETMKHCI
jgi:hypothetical protein